MQNQNKTKKHGGFIPPKNRMMKSKTKSVKSRTKSITRSAKSTKSTKSPK